MAETRQYELVYVISPDAGDEAVAGLHAQVEEIVTARGGRIEKTDNWGRRRLAYEIDRHKEGTYVLELFSGSGAVVGELDRRLKVTDNVLRYLIVRVDEDLRKAEHARSKRQARRQRRRGARGGAPPPADAAPAGAAAAPESAAGASAPEPAVVPVAPEVEQEPAAGPAESAPAGSADPAPKAGPADSAPAAGPAEPAPAAGSTDPAPAADSTDRDSKAEVSE